MEVELINADVPGGRIVLSDQPALIGRSRNRSQVESVFLTKVIWT